MAHTKMTTKKAQLLNFTEYLNFIFNNNKKEPNKNNNRIFTFNSLVVRTYIVPPAKV